MDPIADMFTKIRNGYAAGKESVAVPHSKLKMEIAKVMKKEKYIKEAVRRGKKVRKNIEIILLYGDGKPAVRKIIRVSKPSRRVYISLEEMFSLGRGYGKRILSTPRGVLTDADARKEKVGGEVIAEIW